MKKILLILLLLLPFYCNPSYAQFEGLKSKWNTIINTTFSQLSYIESGVHKFIYKGDALFSGTAWSNDGKTVKMIVRDGEIEEVYLYFNNNKLALKYVMENGNRKHEYYYNKIGKSITKQEFKKEYSELRRKMDVVGKEIKKKK